MTETKGGAAERSAGVVGVSVGTCLVALAKLVPPDQPVLRDTLIFIAPAATVACRFIWTYVQVWIKTQAERIFRRWAMDSSLREARQMRDKVLEDPKSTAQSKRAAKLNVEKFEALSFEVLHDETKALSKRREGQTRARLES